MREIFAPTSSTRKDYSERIYYTITADDIGKRYITTTEGTIALGDVIGYVQPDDVGTRLYRIPLDGGIRYIWQAESRDQRTHRYETDG